MSGLPGAKAAGKSIRTSCSLSAAVAPGLAFLTQYGNPYTLVLRDPEGQTGINFGVYGVPETFIIDKKGIIRHKVIGPMMQKEWTNDVKPLLAKLEAE